jgi:hypothetical protein
LFPFAGLLRLTITILIGNSKLMLDNRKKREKKNQKLLY